MRHTPPRAADLRRRGEEDSLGRDDVGTDGSDNKRPAMPIGNGD